MNSQNFHSPINRYSTGVFVHRLTRANISSYNCHSRRFPFMRKQGGSNNGQILLFPNGERASLVESDSPSVLSEAEPNRIIESTRPNVVGCDVVLSGSFRKDVEGLRNVHTELLELGCKVLSPTHVEPSREVDGFVYMRGEEVESPERIELKHLEAIQKASFVWLHAPNGYVGLSAALEVGFAHAQGVPVFCRTQVSDGTLRPFVREAETTSEAVRLFSEHKLPIPTPNTLTFQRYYKRVASQRGYERETAQNCLLLMVEEVGELARAIRKREKLVRHGPPGRSSESQELADVFLYVIHMANILGLDLGSAVHDKELLNISKFVRAR
jgi:NTP pyrophosphatase (non-canonical NTP hydrolase)